MHSEFTPPLQLIVGVFGNYWNNNYINNNKNKEKIWYIAWNIEILLTYLFFNNFFYFTWFPSHGNHAKTFSPFFLSLISFESVTIHKRKKTRRRRDSCFVGHVSKRVWSGIFFSTAHNGNNNKKKTITKWHAIYCIWFVRL